MKEYVIFTAQFQYNKGRYEALWIDENLKTSNSAVIGIGLACSYDEDKATEIAKDYLRKHCNDDSPTSRVWIHPTDKPLDDDCSIEITLDERQVA